MAKVDFFETYEKHVKPILTPVEVENNDSDDLFHLDDTKIEEKSRATLDISDDVLEKLAQRVAGIMKEGVPDEVDNVWY